MSMPFAEDYFEARSHFLLAAGRAGARVETLWHPTATAPNGAPIAADVARLGRSDASHVLFTVCGTHGVEGYPGSAAQIALLESGRLGSLPPHVAVVFLHGLNPFGWARDSQRNEDGIDINRNFVDFSALPEPDVDLIERFAAIMKIEHMSFSALGDAMERLAQIRDSVGGARFMQALAAGQYVQPMGLKFGGLAPSWSNTIYRDVVRRYLGQASHVAEVDWHTGLGSYGGTFPLFFGRKGSDEFEVTCDWFGRAGVERGMVSWSVDDDDAVAPEYSGLTHCALVEELPGARIAGGVVEFGTLPVSQIAMAVFLDHWLLHDAQVDETTQFWRAQMRTFMAPREQSWERSVLHHAAEIYARTVDGLCQWR